MMTRRNSLAVAGITLLLATMLASSAFASTIVGRARDAYRQNVVGNVKVTLIGADGPDSVITSTTTSADGTYRFDGLPEASYYLYFTDASDRYWPVWFDGSDDFIDAESVDTSNSVDTSADIELMPTHIKYAAHLETATVSEDVTTTVYLGESATLETTATDAFWGFPLFGMHMTLQSSADQSTWTDVGPALDPAWDGTYSATIEPQISGVRYYRFAIADALDAEATTSPSVRLEAKVPVTSWQGATFANAAATDISVTGPAFQGLKISGRLLDRLGAAKTGAHVVVQGSADGANWTTDTGMPAVSSADGWYQATVLSGKWTFYRFAYTVGANELSSASAPVTIRAPWAMAWKSVPKPTVRKGKKVYFVGNVWPAVGSTTKLVYAIIDSPQPRGWKVLWKGWVPVKRVGNDTIFTVTVNAKLRRGYRVRASISRSDAYRMANKGISGFVYAK